MQRTGTLLEKEPHQTGIFEGAEHSYVHCILADIHDPERHFECRVLDVTDVPVAIGKRITLDVLKVVTDRHSGTVRFDCRLAQGEE